MDFYIKEDIDKIINELKPHYKSIAGKNFLIAGGGGFLGPYISIIVERINKILSKKSKIVVLDSFINQSNINEFKKLKNIKLIRCNIINKINIPGRFDFIINAAGIASPYYYSKYPLETLDVAIIGTRNLLNLARKNSSKFIFFSSSEIYGDPNKDNIPTKEDYRGNVSTSGTRACYDESKRLGETLCYIYNKEYNLHTNCIRPFNIYGPGMKKKDFRVLPNFAQQIKKGGKLKVYGSGKQTRTYCYIVDAIIGFFKVFVKGKPGEIYNIGNSKPEISVKELVKIICKILKEKKISYSLIKYPSSYPPDEPRRRCPSLRKAKIDLDYSPVTPLEKGLKNFFKWTNLRY